jgi:hypothetical protein
LKDNRQYVTEVEADVRPDKDLDEPEYKAAFGGHEYAHELEQDGKLCGQNSWRVDDSVDVNQLKWLLASAFCYAESTFRQ